MTNPIVQETNATTGETSEREMTAAEVKSRDALFAEMSKLISDNAGKAEQKAALLERLGISEEEAHLLLS